VNLLIARYDDGGATQVIIASRFGQTISVARTVCCHRLMAERTSQSHYRFAADRAPEIRSTIET